MAKSRHNASCHKPAVAPTALRIQSICLPPQGPADASKQVSAHCVPAILSLPPCPQEYSCLKNTLCPASQPLLGPYPLLELLTPPYHFLANPACLWILVSKSLPPGRLPRLGGSLLEAWPRRPLQQFIGNKFVFCHLPDRIVSSTSQRLGLLLHPVVSIPCTQEVPNKYL